LTAVSLHVVPSDNEFVAHSIKPNNFVMLLEAMPYIASSAIKQKSRRLSENVFKNKDNRHYPHSR